jgi:hypothetical protein
MKISQLIACAVLCLSALSLHAQDLESIKWGKIPDADLKMTVYAKDTAAEAVVLANVANLTYNLAADLAKGTSVLSTSTLIVIN